jgi:hypothetical protein
MSDKTQPEIDHEREQLINSLTMEDLTMLSSSQFQMVQRAQLQRLNERARARIEAALAGKIKEVADALTTPPFVYRSDSIRVMAGCEVRFASLMTAQLRDAHSQLDKFISDENPNDIRMSDFLNRLLLSHSIISFNGDDFGGVAFDPADYQGLRTAKPDDALKMLEELRKQRLRAIDELSPHLVQRLIEYYQAFQLMIEEMTKGDEMAEAVGN